MNTATELQGRQRPYLRVFRYRRYASGWLVAVFFAWTFGVVVQAAIWWFPFEDPSAFTNMLILLGVSVPFAVYCVYIVMVNNTAVLLIDNNGITYRDRYVKVRLDWSEISELTPRWIRSDDGTGIYFELGLRAIENWEELQGLVIQRAGLTDIRKGKLLFGGEGIMLARRPQHES
ncbi:MAG TPA: hypothetical protein EYP10_11715 [Armatimonadetes bacterium]|nr:hypothetical protein [Armatimonadota bacterium]